MSNAIGKVRVVPIADMRQLVLSDLHSQGFRVMVDA
jgi:hypothetical protein